MTLQQDPRSMAFGVEPGYAPYRLRQARYQALAEDVGRLAAERLHRGEPPLRLLDVGVYDGCARRYIEVHEAAAHIQWHGVDIFPEGQEFVYKHQDWTLYEMDLERGLPDLPSGYFDVAICEQVLEHLTHPKRAAAEIARVVKPGGSLIMGVPIFPDGIHWVRKYAVPVVDQLLRVKKVRGHVQAFSLRTFTHLLRGTEQLRIDRSRGFRLVSGGVLRPLEYCRWWWEWNRWLGSLVPSLCIEAQVIATRLPAVASTPRNSPLAATASRPVVGSHCKAAQRKAA